MTVYLQECMQRACHDVACRDVEGSVPCGKERQAGEGGADVAHESDVAGVQGDGVGGGVQKAEDKTRDGGLWDTCGWDT